MNDSGAKMDHLIKGCHSKS